MSSLLFADDEQHGLVSRPRADQSGDAGRFGLRANAFVQPAFMMGFLVLIGTAFWKRSLGWGLAVLNVTLIRKVVLSVMLTGKTAGRPSEIPSLD